MKAVLLSFFSLSVFAAFGTTIHPLECAGSAPGCVAIAATDGQNEGTLLASSLADLVTFDPNTQLKVQIGELLSAAFQQADNTVLFHYQVALDSGTPFQGADALFFFGANGGVFNFGWAGPIDVSRRTDGTSGFLPDGHLAASVNLLSGLNIQMDYGTPLLPGEHTAELVLGIPDPMVDSFRNYVAPPGNIGYSYLMETNTQQGIAIADGGILVPTQTPEPATMLLFTGGLALLLFSRIPRRSLQAVKPALLPEPIPARGRLRLWKHVTGAAG